MKALRAFLGKLAGVAVLFGFFFGVLVLLFAPLELAKKARAEHWPARQGVVTLSYVRQAGGWGRTARYDRPEICGEYLDTRARFCITHVRLGEFRWGTGTAAAEADVRHYPPGRKVDVFHDPDDPRETLLEARSPWTAMVVLCVLGAIGLLLPVALWIIGRIISRRASASPG